MAITVERKTDQERGQYYEIDMSANGDVVQAWLRFRTPYGAGFGGWQRGDISWHKTANVAATFTNAGEDAMAITGGNGVLAGWVTHPDTANSEASETLPITGLRFTAGAATQTVLLYTREYLVVDPEDAGTPA